MQSLLFTVFNTRHQG